MITCDSQRLGLLQESLRIQHIYNDSEIKVAVRNWFESLYVKFDDEEICALVSRQKKAVQKARNYFENNEMLKLYTWCIFKLCVGHATIFKFNENFFHMHVSNVYCFAIFSFVCTLLSNFFDFVLIWAKVK